MDATRRVLVLGATGRTGGRVVAQLLDRGVAVRAIVRSADRLPEDVAGHPLLEVVEADLLTMPTADLVDSPRRLRRGDLVSGPHHQRPWRARPAARPGSTRVAVRYVQRSRRVRRRHPCA